MLAIRKATFGCTSRGPNIPVSLHNAVLDGLFTEVEVEVEVEPGVRGANFIRVVEDVAKTVVNDVTKTNIVPQVLRPKFPKPWSESFVKA